MRAEVVPGRKAGEDKTEAVFYVSFALDWASAVSAVEVPLATARMASPYRWSIRRGRNRWRLR